MSEENKNDQRSRREHVALTDEGSERIAKWFEQINAKKKIKISRKELINYLLVKRLSETFSAGELNALIDHFYDGEQFIRQILREVQTAKANGTTENFEIIVRPKRPEKKDADDLAQVKSDNLG